MAEGFICRRRGGGGLPSTIAAGNTPIYINTTSWSETSGGYVNKLAVLIKKAGTYRFTFAIHNAQNSLTAYGQLTRNGVAVASSEVGGYISSVLKTIDIACAANDIVRLQMKHTNGSMTFCDYFLVSAAAATLQAELDLAVVTTT